MRKRLYCALSSFGQLGGHRPSIDQRHEIVTLGSNAIRWRIWRGWRDSLLRLPPLNGIHNKAKEKESTEYALLSAGDF